MAPHLLELAAGLRKCAAGGSSNSSSAGGDAEAGAAAAEGGDSSTSASSGGGGGNSEIGAARLSASVALVYIAEAHAEDEWPVRSSRYNGGRGPVCLRQSATSAQRAAHAAAFAAAFGLLPGPQPPAGRRCEEAQVAARRADKSGKAEQGQKQGCKRPAAELGQDNQEEKEEEEEEEEEQEQERGEDAPCPHEALLPVFVDPAEREPFSAALAPWPARYYAFEVPSRKLVFVSQPSDAADVDLAPLTRWMMRQGLV